MVDSPKKNIARPARQLTAINSGFFSSLEAIFQFARSSLNIARITHSGKKIVQREISGAGGLRSKRNKGINAFSARGRRIIIVSPYRRYQLAFTNNRLIARLEISCPGSRRKDNVGLDIRPGICSTRGSRTRNGGAFASTGTPLGDVHRGAPKASLAQA